MVDITLSVPFFDVINTVIKFKNAADDSAAYPGSFWSTQKYPISTSPPCAMYYTITIAVKLIQNF